MVLKPQPNFSLNHSSGLSVASAWCCSHWDQDSNPSSATRQLCVLGKRTYLSVPHFPLLWNGDNHTLPRLPDFKMFPSDSLPWYSCFHVVPSHIEYRWSVWAVGCHGNDRMWLLRLGYKTNSDLLSLDSCCGGSQPPCCEGTQVAPHLSSPQGRELRSPANSATLPGIQRGSMNPSKAFWWQYPWLIS